jgi:hypothetical protein
VAKVGMLVTLKQSIYALQIRNGFCFYQNIIFENNLRNYYLRMPLYELKRKSKKSMNLKENLRKKETFQHNTRNIANSNVFELQYGKMFLILTNYSF